MIEHKNFEKHICIFLFNVELKYTTAVIQLDLSMNAHFIMKMKAAPRISVNYFSLFKVNKLDSGSIPTLINHCPQD